MMAKVQEKLPELFALAQDRGELARIRLAEELAGLFYGDDITLSPREEEALEALLEALLKTADPDMRKRLVSKFTNVARMPRSLALRMASDAPDVAQRVLCTNEYLSDGDLMMLINVKGRDHARFIAQRELINEAVVDALVVTGDLTVMQLVAENLGAQLSVRAISFLVDAARLTTALQKPLAMRAELTEEAAIKLYWWTAREIRNSILLRFGIRATRLEAECADVIQEKLNSCFLERNDDLSMEALADWLGERISFTPPLLLQILRINLFRLFNVIVARLAKLDIDAVDQIVVDHSGRMLAAVCRAIGINRATFVSIFLLSRAARADEHIVHPHELSLSLNAFDRMAREDAERLLVTWRNDPSSIKRIRAEGIDVI